MKIVIKIDNFETKADNIMILKKVQLKYNLHVVLSEGFVFFFNAPCFLFKENNG